MRSILSIDIPWMTAGQTWRHPLLPSTPEHVQEYGGKRQRTLHGSWAAQIFGPDMAMGHGTVVPICEHQNRWDLWMWITTQIWYYRFWPMAIWSPCTLFLLMGVIIKIIVTQSCDHCLLLQQISKRWMNIRGESWVKTSTRFVVWYVLSDDISICYSDWSLMIHYCFCFVWEAIHNRLL